MNGLGWAGLLREGEEVRAYRERNGGAIRHL